MYRSVAPALGGGNAQIFVTVATYELGKQLGVQGAATEFARQCASPTKNDLPAARMIARLRMLGDVQLFHCFGTVLPKLRSRAAWAAHTSGADFWLMLDDDVETDTSTLNALFLAATPSSDRRVVALPCRMRGTAEDASRLNCRFEGSIAALRNGVPVRPCYHAGTGCMVVTRAALHALVERYKDELAWCDDDGVWKAALFEMLREPPEWWGEDYSFCRRVRDAGCELVALATGISVHDGEAFSLDQA